MMLAVAGLATVVVPAATVGGRVLPPTPPPMTSLQVQYMARVERKAQAASEAAVPALLGALDDHEFRQTLTECCPDIAQLKADELLAWYQRQTDVSEMVHNFNAAPPTAGQHGHGGDPDLEVYENSTWFYNLWEPWVLNLTSASPGGPEDAMEAGPFGLPEFKNGHTPANLEEAEQRPVYTAFNNRMVDAGNPMFGDVSMVFSPDFVRPMTIIAPMDTGLWVMQCNTSANVFPHPPPCMDFTNATTCSHGWGCRWANHTDMPNGGFCGDWGCANVTDASDCKNMFGGSCIWTDSSGGSGGTCSDNPHAHHHHGPPFGGGNCSVPDWDNKTDTFNLGTLQHYNHLILANLRWWNQSIASGLGTQFARMYNPSGLNISSSEWFQYWEADIVGSVAYPHGIKMVVATFRSLFGTNFGQRVQEWCKRQGWVLVWALGSNTEEQMGPGGGGDSKYAVDARSTRILDPIVFGETSAAHNTSLSPALQQFQALWRLVATNKNENTTSAEYRAWFDELPREPGLVRALLAGECSDASACVGTSSTGECICYQN